MSFRWSNRNFICLVVLHNQYRLNDSEFLLLHVDMFAICALNLYTFYAFEVENFADFCYFGRVYVVYHFYCLFWLCFLFYHFWRLLVKFDNFALLSKFFIFYVILLIFLGLILHFFSLRGRSINIFFLFL
jgi:hypothetical protein